MQHDGEGARGRVGTTDQATIRRHVDHTYRDFSRYDGPYPKQKKAGKNFPAKLHAMLSTPDLAHIITWMPHGRAWKILDKPLFLSTAIPAHFGQSKFEHFTRQLSGWGFKRLHRPGADCGAYYHQCFLRGLPLLVSLMERPPTSQGKRQPCPGNEPNFYRISSAYPVPPETGSSAEDPSPPAPMAGQPAASVASPVVHSPRTTSQEPSGRVSSRSHGDSRSTQAQKRPAQPSTHLVEDQHIDDVQQLELSGRGAMDRGLQTSSSTASMSATAVPSSRDVSSFAFDSLASDYSRSTEASLRQENPTLQYGWNRSAPVFDSSAAMLGGVSAGFAAPAANLQMPSDNARGHSEAPLRQESPPLRSFRDNSAPPAFESFLSGGTTARLPSGFPSPYQMQSTTQGGYYYNSEANQQSLSLPAPHYASAPALGSTSFPGASAVATGGSHYFSSRAEGPVTEPNNFNWQGAALSAAAAQQQLLQQLGNDASRSFASTPALGSTSFPGPTVIATRSGFSSHAESYATEPHDFNIQGVALSAAAAQQQSLQQLGNTASRSHLSAPALGSTSFPGPTVMATRSGFSSHAEAHATDPNDFNWQGVALSAAAAQQQSSQQLGNDASQSQEQHQKDSPTANRRRSDDSLDDDFGRFLKEYSM